MVLVWTSLKSLGAQEVDIVGALKGRGYSTSPETLEKKTLRLLRRRMLSSYSQRKSTPKNIVGFSSGICVRIQSPSPCTYSGHSWQDLLESLEAVDFRSGWIVYEIVKGAIDTLLTYENLSTQRLVQLLRFAISPEAFNLTDASKTKRIAALVLRKFGGRWTKKNDGLNFLENSWSVLGTAFDIWEAQCKSSISVAKPLFYPESFGLEESGWGSSSTGIRAYLQTIDPELYPEIRTKLAWEVSRSALHSFDKDKLMNAEEKEKDDDVNVDDDKDKVKENDQLVINKSTNIH